MLQEGAPGEKMHFALLHVDVQVVDKLPEHLLWQIISELVIYGGKLI